MQHGKISRRVENLPNGVKTWTTSEDPQVVPLIQQHANMAVTKLFSREVGCMALSMPCRISYAMYRKGKFCI
jgi:hypothetical protein